MELRCENCGAPLGAPKAFGGTVVCPFCKTEQSGLANAGGAGQRARSPLPEKFHIESDANGFALSWRWFQGVHIAFAIISVIWFAILAAIYTAIAHAQGLPGAMRIFVLLFPLAHVAVGMGLAYYTLTGFLNSTRVTLRDGLLKIAHGPLPWPGRRTLKERSLVQLYTREQVTYRSNGGPLRSYELYAIDANGQQIRLLQGLPQADQALWLEEELERRLKIVDAPVEGEYAKRRSVAGGA